MVSGEPLSDGLWGGVKEAGCGFDAVCEGVLDDAESQIELVCLVGHTYYLFPIGQRRHLWALIFAGRRYGGPILTGVSFAGVARQGPSPPAPAPSIDLSPF